MKKKIKKENFKEKFSKPTRVSNMKQAKMYYDFASFAEYKKRTFIKS